MTEIKLGCRDPRSAGPGDGLDSGRQPRYLAPSLDLAGFYGSIIYHPPMAGRPGPWLQWAGIERSLNRQPLGMQAGQVDASASLPDQLAEYRTPLPGQCPITYQ